MTAHLAQFNTADSYSRLWGLKNSGFLLAFSLLLFLLLLAYWSCFAHTPGPGTSHLGSFFTIAFTWKHGVLRFTGSQRVGHDWATELNWTDLESSSLRSQCSLSFFFYDSLIKCYHSSEDFSDHSKINIVIFTPHFCFIFILSPC